MKGRHLKLIGILAMLLCVCFAGGLYLYVAFHYRHMWSLLVNTGLLLLAFFTPAIAYGYNNEDPVFMNTGNMSLNGFLNCRDFCYVLALVFFTLTYVMPTVAWSYGLNMFGTVFVYFGNTLLGYAFVLWWVIFLSGGSTDSYG